MPKSAKCVLSTHSVFKGQFRDSVRVYCNTESYYPCKTTTTKKKKSFYLFVYLRHTDFPITSASDSDSIQASGSLHTPEDSNILDPDSEVVPSTICTTPISINVGSYVLVKNGLQYLPACIVRDESAGLAIRYYDRTGDCYSPQEATYGVLSEDFVKNLQEPAVSTSW